MIVIGELFAADRGKCHALRLHDSLVGRWRAGQPLLRSASDSVSLPVGLLCSMIADVSASCRAHTGCSRSEIIDIQVKPFDTGLCESTLTSTL